MALFNFGTKSKLGIDIGTASIKIAELSKESGRFKLENYGLLGFDAAGSEPRPVTGRAAGQETNRDKSETGQEASDDDLVWAIKEIISKSKMKARDVVASLPSLATFATIITMPYLSEKDIAKTIPFEARKYIPLPLNEVVMDWSIVNIAGESAPSPLAKSGLPVRSGQAKAPTVDVFLVAVPKSETERRQAIIKKAGLNLKALEIENAALIRALIGNDLSASAIINIGGQSSSILIVENGIERVSHNFEIGSFAITNSIARSLGVSLKRAEELKRKLGLKEEEGNTVKEPIISLLDLVILETQKTVHNYEDLKKTTIGKALLVGGLANMPMFAEYFGKKLGVPTALGSPLSRVVYQKELEPLKNEINSTFAIALGLGMREI